MLLIFLHSLSTEFYFFNSSLLCRQISFDTCLHCFSIVSTLFLSS
ncbi:hypothetical protein HMPREF0373_02353 [Eubacterium ramulus ATCC 29099]|uniref:Uncharacterized protein n=1 Tax=Eubacterium ramulus ATCC 29099 TaxID=1256908 RepID=U2PIT6_EUBRA|nr:hypothetical protein HMPREF0373_02353 [Eubacterium ramulus ATCC 29099]